MAALSLSTALALLGLATLLAAPLRRRLDELRRLQYRAAVRRGELQRLRELRAQMTAAQVLAEQVVEGGTATVRTVHKSIANIPFAILESIPVTRDTTRVVRRIHDVISDGVYGGISAGNKVLHEVARSATQMARPPASVAADEQDPPKPPVEKK
jgi:hypothetical protein